MPLVLDSKYCHKVRTYKEYHSVCPSTELGLPPTPTPRLVCPLPPVSGGRGTLAGEKGVGRVPIPTRGIHCGTLYMYVLCEYCRRSTVYVEQLWPTYTDSVPNWPVIALYHGGIWRTIKCRLCRSCYRTGLPEGGIATEIDT